IHRFYFFGGGLRALFDSTIRNKKIFYRRVRDCLQILVFLTKRRIKTFEKTDGRVNSIVADKMRFKFLNIEAIAPPAIIVDIKVWSFILKKAYPLNGKFSYGQHKISFLDNLKALWSEIPRIVASKQPTISFIRIFSPHGMNESLTLSIQT